MLYIIGLGLGDEKDITIKGLEAVKKCTHIYLENYTSMLNCSVKNLEKLYGKRITLAPRTSVEEEDEILNNAKKADVALLVIGDALSATTHISIIIKAKHQNIKVKIIHNASIFTAVAITGLQLYRFGKTTSIPFPEKSFAPETAYDVLKNNEKNNLHTLFLLDIKPDKLMSCDEAKEILLNIENNREEKAISKETKCFCCAALGTDEQEVTYCALGEKSNLAKFPQCLIIPSELHFSEQEFIDEFF